MPFAVLGLFSSTIIALSFGDIVFSVGWFLPGEALYVLESIEAAGAGEAGTLLPYSSFLSIYTVALRSSFGIPNATFGDFLLSSCLPKSAKSSWEAGAAKAGSPHSANTLGSYGSNLSFDFSLRMLLVLTYLSLISFYLSSFSSLY